MQKFERTSANVQSTMLFLAATALVMPAIFEMVQGKGLPAVNAEIVDYGSTVERLSLAVAVVLLATYVAGLLLLAAHAQGHLQPRLRKRRPR